jgi:hypothetical protein
MGLTENMSRGDVLVLLDDETSHSELPAVGDSLIVEIDLPANHIFGRKCMQCQASVVRMSRSESGAPRMALRIHKMRFQSCARPASTLLKAKGEIRQLLM